MPGLSEETEAEMEEQSADRNDGDEAADPPATVSSSTSLFRDLAFAYPSPESKDEDG